MNRFEAEVRGMSYMKWWLAKVARLRRKQILDNRRYGGSLNRLQVPTDSITPPVVNPTTHIGVHYSRTLFMGESSNSHSRRPGNCSQFTAEFYNDKENCITNLNSTQNSSMSKRPKGVRQRKKQFGNIVDVNSYASPCSTNPLSEICNAVATNKKPGSKTPTSNRDVVLQNKRKGKPTDKENYNSTNGDHGSNCQSHGNDVPAEPLRLKKRQRNVRRLNVSRTPFQDITNKRSKRRALTKTSSSTRSRDPNRISRQLIGEFNNTDEPTPGYNRNFQWAEEEDLLDVGDPTSICQYCQANMWYEERKGKRRRSTNPKFSLCCMQGKVVLPHLKKPPTLLFNLIVGIDHRSKHFIDNIRAFNSMFAFTSMGGKVVSSINNGGGPPQFVLSGQNYHRIGSLLPEPGKPPKFAQLYIYDTQNEIANRMKPFRSSNNSESLDLSLVEELKEMIDKDNVLAQSFRSVRDYLETNDPTTLSLRLFRKRGKDPRTHNMPTCDEVAALIVGDFDSVDLGRDIVVHQNDGVLRRIHETYTAFIPLQYPLLFPYGEDGYQEDIMPSDWYKNRKDINRFRVTLREFISYRIQERDTEHGNIVLCRRLFQQFLVDCYSMIEAQRLSFLRSNQHLIRAEFLNGLEEAITRGECDPSSIGTRIILPASFTGGKRYMFNCCQDAMAICKRYGYPDLFITTTCNSTWKEIERFVRKRNLRADERPDICCRVFKMKLDHLMLQLKKGTIFGPFDAGMYTVEFQKRGLPHAHILIWLKKDHKLRTTTDIDKHISAEIPDPELYPKLYKAVASYMMHGPCGHSEPKSPCMTDRKCSKFFPKKYQESTIIDGDGYPVYRRRDSGLTITKKNIKLDNGFVVPYNPRLLMIYNGHINVEACNKSNAIKYLFKYISKGPDRVSVEISNSANEANTPEVEDEIKQYYDCRYLTPCEASWRTYKYEIHCRCPSVKKLTFHLPHQQRVLFNDNDDLKSVVDRSASKDTMFLAWMAANRKYTIGKEITYADFPSKFVYDESDREWTPRKRGTAIGRLQFIPHGCGEIYYMRVLLTVQFGCTSFESIRTVNGIVYPTFHDACFAKGLLADDKEYIDAIIEANELGSGHQLRTFFVTLLTTNTMSKPENVWEKTWKLLSDSIVYDRRKELNLPGLQVGDDDLQNLCLIEIEKLLVTNGRTLREFPCLKYPSFCDSLRFENKFIADELNYSKEEMEVLHTRLYRSLTSEQEKIYQVIMNSVMTKFGGLYFLYGFGGSGKTFVWNTLSAAIRSKGLIVLNVASSGIASLLLPGGRTAHSRFSIPIAINDCSTCNISQGSHKAELLQQASLIIWDEAPMLNKHCFEALDRTLTDIMKHTSPTGSKLPFGGKVVVLGGDFRQILPVIQKGSRSDIVDSSINSSYLWEHCTVLKLTKNMRLIGSNCPNEKEEVNKFANWILDLGDGEIKSSGDEDSVIDIPHDLLIEDEHDSLQKLIQFAYPNMIDNLDSKNYGYFEERAVLAPTLDSVEEVNNYMLSLIKGKEEQYLSCDSTCKSDAVADVDPEWFTSEFLNGIKCSGIPNHKLVLKVGVPIMLLRNIDQSGGLCNGTRLITTELGKNVIAANVVTGKRAGDKIFIPRMNLIPSDTGLPFKFQRRQFPISLCFAMTINKSQGQSLSQVGIYLPKPVFTHGQLYVAISRVKSRKGLKILIINEDGSIASSTKNVVYKEVFDNI